ncbi:hypothetical protein V2J09_000645, partial [Rumex salicifolius]
PTPYRRLVGKVNFITNFHPDVLFVVQHLRLLHELEVPSLHLVSIKYYSKAAIHIAKYLVFHERNEHIDIDCHYVRSQLSQGLINLTNIPTPTF